MNSKPVVLSERNLQKLFNLPLYKAAEQLGICATALKSACRKLGIKKWPFRAQLQSQSSNSNAVADKNEDNAAAGSDNLSSSDSNGSLSSNNNVSYGSDDQNIFGDLGDPTTDLSSPSSPLLDS
eukprot:748400-Hanusia_phi.AAC.15